MMLGGTDDTYKTIFMVDFGLSTVYRLKDGNHVPFKENVGSIGTMRFNSINCHKVNIYFKYTILILYFLEIIWFNFFSFFGIFNIFTAKN